MNNNEFLEASLFIQWIEFSYHKLTSDKGKVHVENTAENRPLCVMQEPKKKRRTDCGKCKVSALPEHRHSY